MYKVMIVDDEMLVRIGVKALIDWQELGFEIIAEASNGLSAFEKYVALKPDVVITDIKMPKQDGLWLTKKIKEHNPDTEIILLTCYDDFSYAKEAIKLKVSDYILKAEMEEEELKGILLEKKKKLDETIGKNIVNGNDKFLLKKQQESLLGLILSSKQSIDVIKKEFEKANLEWNTRSYCFLQFDFGASFKNEKNSDVQIANIITACFELIINKFKDEDVEIFYKQFGKSITCFVMANNLNELKLKRWVSYLHSSIRQYFNIGFKSANSPIKDTIEEARGYLDWIFEASDYIFYLSDGEHLTKETMHRRSDVQFINDSSVVKEFCEYIEEANNEAIIRKVKQIEKMIDEYRGNSLEAKLELSHMINDIFKRFDILFQDDKDVFAFQKKLMDAQELREAIEITIAFVNNVMEENANSRLDNTDLLIKKAVQYIEDNYSNKISLDDIAGHVGISKYYFSVLFKKEKEITFSNYLNSVRIDKAKQLLKNPQVTVSAVAYELGFNDPQYFSKTFKKYAGMTVTEYRSRYGK